MAKGKKTGGRTKGVPNKVTAALRAELADRGETPLDYMLRVLRDPDADPERRDRMASAAAPYIHPKLAQIETNANVKITSHDEALAEIEQAMAVDISVGHGIAH